MANTIYASFNDPALAEKAAGALMDFGARPEDISLIRGGDGRVENMATINNADANTYEASPLTTPPPVPLGAIPPTAYEVDQAVIAGGDAVREEDRVRYAESDVITSETERRAAVESHDLSTGQRWDNPEGSEYETVGPDGDGDDLETAAKLGISTTTAADAGAGALKGGAWGLGIGVVAGLAAMIVPGVGIVLGGGALVAAIAGAVATVGAGAAAGAITGFLKDQGVEEHVASEYVETVNKGGAILAITLPSGKVDEVKAREVIDKYGAANVKDYASRTGYVA